MAGGGTAGEEVEGDGVGLAGAAHVDAVLHGMDRLGVGKRRLAKHLFQQGRPMFGRAVFGVEPGRDSHNTFFIGATFVIDIVLAATVFAYCYIFHVVTDGLMAPTPGFLIAFVVDGPSGRLVKVRRLFE